ncbi:ATP-binding cassette sub-family E member 1, partial [Trichinella britovi]
LLKRKMSKLPKPGHTEQSKITRIAIVNNDRCKPKNCGQVCKKSCPVVRMGKLCIEVTPSSKIAFISESLCIGCGICVKKCPYDAISIINLPSNLEKHTTHRYGPNSFKLHRLPTPRPGEILGLVGTNGIGKSTALKILSGKLKPNLGKYKEPPEWQEILTYFRGSELQNYFTKLLEDNLRAVIKPQYVDQIPQAAKGLVSDMIAKKDDLKKADAMCRLLDLENVMDRNVADLSGGELQRFAIAVVCIQRADIYMFDEPSSYLDVKQRLKAAVAVRSLVHSDNFSIVVEHDLSVLDYLSDFICVLYGVPGAYGVVTMPFSVREGINIFLDGFVPTENLRFRETSLSFKVSDQGLEEHVSRACGFQYPSMKKSLGMRVSQDLSLILTKFNLGNFELTVEAGNFSDSEIIVLLGENGTGKTTMIRMLAGRLEPDVNTGEIPQLNISYKPQKISPKSNCKVSELLRSKIPDTFVHPQFVAEVLKPLNIEDILDQDVQNLSGGELQRVALVLCLGKSADVYLIDEPSAYLDSEQRLHAAKVIKRRANMFLIIAGEFKMKLFRHILNAKKTAFIVEHDFIMATYLADRVIVFEGEPSKHALATCPQSLLKGMNRFLERLDITFRRDPNNYRPRINKLNSVKYRCFSRTVYLRQMQSGLLERCRLMKVIFCAANRGCSDGPTVIMSGIQPSGRLHVGNYFGVISQLLKLQADGCQLYVSVADLHAMTVPRQPDELRRNVFNVTSGLLACGLGTGRGTALFQQSRLGEHSELCWMLGTLVTLPKLLRMSHYREKAALYRDGNVPLALLTYPVLQAADVLLYRARAVPVGEDQSQHLRLAHRLAELFNNKYSVRFFPLPERLLSNWPRLKNLREPDKKMSKSQPAGCIFLDDTADEIRSKVKKAVTDSAGGLWFDPQRRPGVSNLIRLKAACTDSTVDDVVARCAGQDVVQFKENLAEALVETLKPIRLKYQALEKQPDQLKAALDDGLAKASVRAQQTMVAFKRIVGLTL